MKGLRNPFKRKEPNVAKEQASAAGAATIDQESVNKMVASAITAALPSIGTAIAEANKPLLEQIAKLQPAAATPAETAAKPGEAGAAKPLTLDDVTKVIKDTLGERDRTASTSAARQRFIDEKLKGLPAAYHLMIPQTDDAQQLEAAGKRARETFEADFKVQGGEKKSVGGETTGGAAPAATVDLSKLSPIAKIQMGIKDSKPSATTSQPAGEGAAAAAGAA
jgi:hypothetical protein